VEHATALGMPRDVSADGPRIDWLLNTTLVFLALLFLAMVTWMVTALIAHGRRHPALHDRGDTPRAPLIAGSIAAFVFFVVDGNLMFHSTRDLHERIWNFAYAESQPDALRIELNARQWIWQTRYAGPDGKFATVDDALTVNDLRVPVNTPVVIQLGSSDVIHNLYIPNLRVKQDAMPGTVNRVWFQANEPGEFEIGCAQHCGVNHYKMRAVLTVMPKDAFQAWLAQASADSRKTYDEDDSAAHWGWAWKQEQ
jgi:cytochrome c oxidase subunit 2